MLNIIKYINIEEMKTSENDNDCILKLDNDCILKLYVFKAIKSNE
jgi:hypothetical protein